MSLTLTLSGDGASSDELRALRGWLVEEDELRGHVEMKERPPSSGELGPTLDALMVLGPVGIAALARTVIVWLRTRHSTVRVRIRNEHGAEVEIDASQAQVEDLHELIRTVEAGLSHEEPGDSGRRAVEAGD